jgi:hypothetical protein
MKNDLFRIDATLHFSYVAESMSIEERGHVVISSIVYHWKLSITEVYKDLYTMSIE